VTDNLTTAEYHDRREAAERAKAAAATDGIARKIHSDLAALHAQRAQAMRSRSA